MAGRFHTVFSDLPNLFGIGAVQPLLGDDEPADKHFSSELKPPTMQLHIYCPGWFQDDATKASMWCSSSQIPLIK